MSDRSIFKWFKYIGALMREELRHKKVMRIAKKVMRDYSKAWKKLAKL